MADGGPPSWTEHLAAELRTARKVRGWSQGELADAIRFSRSRVADIETARETPTFDFVAACDSALETNGLFGRILALAKRGDVTARIADLLKAEAQATLVREYHTVFVPGLLQTERYMRALFGNALLAQRDPSEIDEQVAQRMARQEILTKGRLSRYVVILDESVIRRVIGNAEIMREQLDHLLAMMGRRGITVQIMPFRQDTYPASGPIKILSLDGSAVAHLEPPVGNGITTTDATTIQDCNAQFDLLRAQALPLAESAALIRAQIEELGP